MVVRKKSKADLFISLLLILLISLIFVVILQNNAVSNTVKTRLNFLSILSVNSSVNVSRIIDGDTFDIEDGRRIRLASIDAPEYQEQCFSFQSREQLSSLIQGKRVKLEIIKKDNFGRELAFVFVNKQLVQEMMLRAGAAIFIPQTKQTVYDVGLEQAQREARQMQRGLWSSACENKRDPNCNIKANIRKQEKTKIYHLPSCYNYERIVVNERLGDRWFCTEKEAIAAGFAKSLNCR